jgi:hypothetical protein
LPKFTFEPARPAWNATRPPWSIVGLKNEVNVPAGMPAPGAESPVIATFV